MRTKVRRACSLCDGKEVTVLLTLEKLLGMKEALRLQVPKEALMVLRPYTLSVSTSFVGPG